MSINHATRKLILSVGGDPTQTEWEWFVLSGPHGEVFTWGKTKRNPPGYVGVEHLERVVAEKLAADPGFHMKTLDVVTKALQSQGPELLVRAIHVGAVIGAEGELRLIEALRDHENAEVSKQAKAAVFYMRRRVRFMRDGD